MQGSANARTILSPCSPGRSTAKARAQNNEIADRDLRAVRTHDEDLGDIGMRERCSRGDERRKVAEAQEAERIAARKAARETAKAEGAERYRRWR
jgi:hypothetical protein